MPFIEAAIWLALKARIDALTTDPVMPVYEPGATIVVSSDSAGPLPYILASDVRNAGQRLGIDPALQIRSGTLMLAIQWPVGREITHTQLFQIGGDLASQFPADTRMRFGQACARVTRDPDVAQPYRDGANHVCIVRVPWTTM